MYNEEDMKKGLVYLGVMVLALSIFAARQVNAGGCCFKYFSSTDGIAGIKNAQISVAFVDPIQSYAEPGRTTVSLANQKIETHVSSAKPGQFCLGNTEKTDDQGHIDVHCSSPSAGSMLVYFTAPDMSAQANEMIKFATRLINFSSDPNAPASTVTPTPAYDTITPVPTVIQQEEQVGSSSETAELQKRLDALEEKVTTQGVQVNMLQKIINSFLDFFNRLFGSRLP